MTTIQDDGLSTIPFFFEMASVSVRTVSVDIANALAVGESFTTATSALYNLSGGVLVTSPSPAVVGTSIVQVLDGPTLGFSRGEIYDLWLVAGVSSTSKPARHLRIKVIG